MPSSSRTSEYWPIWVYRSVSVELQNHPPAAGSGREKLLEIVRTIDYNGFLKKVPLI
jgi:hypothetical protein